jgi:hypothetical protein
MRGLSLATSQKIEETQTYESDPPYLAHQAMRLYYLSGEHARKVLWAA